MGPVAPPRGLLCPGCGVGLEPIPELLAGGNGSATAEHRLHCAKCGETFRARLRPQNTVDDPAIPTPAQTTEVVPAGSLSLILRGLALQGIEFAYRSGVFVGSLVLLACGGIIPVGRAWLRDEITDLGGLVEALGGVRVVTETKDPDGDLGPVLAYTDAPLLFSAVNEVSRKLGVKPPGQVRLTYLPCCGVVAWGRSQALILGLPLLRVLSLGELRAILAHELAHLARGDATRAARSARFVEGLREAIDRAGTAARGPLGAWARICHRAAERLIGPIARGQESRADRSAAAIAGGSAAASALVKVALVQPLFREVLERYDPADPETPNLYAFFRSFWFRIPAETHTAMRLRILIGMPGQPSNDPAHPPLPDRLALLQAYPDPVSQSSASDSTPAAACLGDLEGFEEMLHNRLYSVPLVEPSLFHRAGT